MVERRRRGRSSCRVFVSLERKGSLMGGLAWDRGRAE